MGLDGRKPTQIAGRWLSVGRAVLWDFTYLCWNLTCSDHRKNILPRKRGDPALVPRGAVHAARQELKHVFYKQPKFHGCRFW